MPNESSTIQSTGWGGHPLPAGFLFIFFFLLSTLLFIPPAPLIFAAGFAFADLCGFWIGSLVAMVLCFVGAWVGAILSFLRSRYMMRDMVELFSKRYPIINAADRAMQRKGFKIMLLLRLGPMIPFNGLNYIGGVTSISLEDFAMSFIGFLPTVMFWAVIGSSADNLSQQQADKKGEIALQLVLTICGIIFGIVALVYVYKHADKELQQELEYKKERRAPAIDEETQTATERTETEHSPRSLERVYDDGDEVIILEEGRIMSTGAEGDRATTTSSEADESEIFVLDDHYPTVAMAAMGLNQTGVAVDRVPDGRRDEDWLWVFA